MENEKIIICQTSDGQTSIDVTLDQDTVWLTQAQIVDLFGSSKADTSEHIKSIFSYNELGKEPFGISEQFGRKVKGGISHTRN